MVRARVLPLLLAVAALAGCSADQPRATYASDWSSDLLLMSVVDGKPTLLGLDTTKAALSALAAVPFDGDLRVDGQTHVVQASGQDLVTLPAGSAAASTLWRVDTTRKALTRVAVLDAGRHIAFTADRLTGVDASVAGHPTARTYALDGKPRQTYPLKVRPSWSAVDAKTGQTCYSGQADDGTVSVERHAWSSGADTTTRLRVDGNLSGLACAGTQVVLAVGDRTQDAAAHPAAGNVSVQPPTRAQPVCIVSPGTGTSGKAAVVNGSVLADVPAAQGRELVQVDCTRGKVLRTVALPEVGDVQAIVPVKGVVVVVGTARVFVVDPQLRAARTVEPIGDLLPMEIQVAGE